MRWLAPVIFSLLGSVVAEATEISAHRTAELRHLLIHDCGSCHGLTMQGGLGPALTPDALTGKSPALLLATILDGRTGTAMPPWRGIINENEGVWLVDQLLNQESKP